MALFVSVTSSANRSQLGFSQNGTSTERWVNIKGFRATFCCIPRQDTLNVLFSTQEYINYGLETVVSVSFSNTRTRLLYNEREIFNTARSEAECSIENFEFIVQ